MPNEPPNVTNKDGCKCGIKRNLVVCIDGTSNKFGPKNTNIVELYSRLVKDKRQLTFYNSGIGTYAEPSLKSLSYWKQVMANKFDLAFALRFEKILLDAYRWLSEMYRHGDRIFLFGFSRGAYQVRALAGMIEKVGLIHKGNEAQIPFAYELYTRSTDNQQDGEPEEDLVEYMSWRFKTTFSRKDVKVHFVGAWDTVSSIGFIRSTKDLPLTTSGMRHVCYFRHALALDERRVKFLPEYAYGGASLPVMADPALQDSSDAKAKPQTKEVHSDINQEPNALDTKANISSLNARVQTKEVWFAGTHSDIGGGNTVNKDLKSYGPALRWMIHEAILAGLGVEPFKVKNMGCGEKKEPDVEKVKPTINESLKRVWWIFEFLPIKHLSYKDSKHTTHCPKIGAPRQVVEGQWIHESAGWKANSHTFKARLPSNWNREPDPKKIEKDLYNSVQNNLELMKKLQINSDFINCLKVLVEISSSPPGLISLSETKNSVQDLYSILRDISRAFSAENSRDGALSADTSREDFSADISLDPRESQWKVTDPKKAAHLMEAAYLTITILLKFHKRYILKHAAHEMPTVITALLNSAMPGYKENAKRFIQTYGTAEILTLRTVTRDDDLGNYMPSSISLDGKYIVISLRKKCTVWDITKRKALAEFEGHSKDVNAVAFSHDGTHIVSGSLDKSVRMWDAATGQGLLTLEGHTGTVISVAFTPNGAQIVSGSYDNTVRVWDVRTGRKPYTLEGHQGVIYSVACSPDSKKIISGSMDQTVHVWDVKTRQVRRALGGHADSVLCVAFSPDHKQIASGSRDRTVRVYNVQTGVIVHVLRGHTGMVCCIAYSGDGKIASGSDDGTVHIWDAKTGKLINIFESHANSDVPQAVFSVRFSPESREVISVSFEGIVRVWDMTNQWKNALPAK
ncbi:WD40 repeat-like protein [Gymnopus androsaceus JB14]|uniref:WD40 repeat-like protein n=1 Tax=Gymnopus androsaceus JB14 TaxID=1447944 RepID=A0A6A4HNL8_9AGAR|nr:WD40 repeat-like protein [Gymnopus androsaceus JB14]